MNFYYILLYHPSTAYYKYYLFNIRYFPLDRSIDRLSPVSLSAVRDFICEIFIDFQALFALHVRLPPGSVVEVCGVSTPLQIRLHQSSATQGVG